MQNFTKTFILCRSLCSYKKLPRIPNYMHKNFYSTTHDLKINDVSVGKYIEHLGSEYETLQSSLGLNVLQNRRFQQLQPIMNLIEERNQVIESISNLKDLFDDKDVEMQKLAKEEKFEFEKQLELVDEKLKELVLPIDEDDERDSIMLEVNAGVGGQEAMLFAKELFDMYCSFAAYKRWDWQVAAFQTTEIGGIRHGSVLLNGAEVFKYFKYEAGVHRVQRIPATEKSGRVHTSTVSVLAIPQPTDIEINLNQRDLKIETKRASGAGGQHVNTTDSAVRITHLPTNISVECQVDRSQIKNRSLAMQRLKTLLYEQQLQAQMNAIESTKKSQVKSNFRNEKIRTYNFSQDRITDHRLTGHNVHNMKGFFEGTEQLETLIYKLDRQSRFNSLLESIKKINNK